jgi:type I restriction enzyme S subunit
MNNRSWDIRSLGDCAKFLSGGTPRKARTEFWEGDIPWVSSGEMTQNRIYDASLHITPEAAEAGSRVVPENTVLAVVRGMSLAKEFRVSITKREVAFNQDLKAFACKPDVDPEFLFYALFAQREHIRQLATEASHGTKKLETGILARVEIPLPRLPVQQRRTVEVARTYDDLIENNRRRIRLLEKAAHLLYEEWFVRLKFPGHEHTCITEGLPQGWERKPLSKLTSFLKRGVTPRYDDDAPGIVINQKCIRDGRLNMNLARNQSREFAVERQVQLGDVLVNSTGEGTLGRIAQVREAIENCTVDTHVTIVRPKPDISILYFGMAVMEWEPRFSTMGRGATNQTELSPAAIGEVEILLPHQTVLRAFDEIAAPIFTQVSNLVSQNDKLRTARDLLLPRLMSGEIEV